MKKGSMEYQQYQQKLARKAARKAAKAAEAGAPVKQKKKKAKEAGAAQAQVPNATNAGSGSRAAQETDDERQPERQAGGEPADSDAELSASELRQRYRQACQERDEAYQVATEQAQRATRAEAAAAEQAERADRAETFAGDLTGGTGPRPQLPAREPDMAKIANRPSSFDGTSSQFHAWYNEMDSYLAIMSLSAEKELALAESYLRGSALEWWRQKKRQLVAKGEPLPASWSAFLPLLSERFEHRNPELAARERLKVLRQGSSTLQQYLKEYESCYSYITDFSEAEKIHSFLYGLQPALKEKFCVDPKTSKWWTSFDALVAHISSYMADDVSIAAGTGAVSSLGVAASAELQDIQAGPAFQAVPGRRFRGNRLRKRYLRQLNQLQRAGVVKPVGGGRGGRGGRDGRGGRGGGRGPGRNGQQGGFVREFTNAAGVTVRRDSAVRRWCHENGQLCMGCYQPNHPVAACHNPVVQGDPPGFRREAR